MQPRAPLGTLTWVEAQDGCPAPAPASPLGEQVKHDSTSFPSERYLTTHPCIAVIRKYGW